LHGLELLSRGASARPRRRSGDAPQEKVRSMLLEGRPKTPTVLSVLALVGALIVVGRSAAAAGDDPLAAPEQNAANRLLVDAKGETKGSVFEMEQFIEPGPGKAGDIGDAIADAIDDADMLKLWGNLQISKPLPRFLQQLFNVLAKRAHRSGDAPWFSLADLAR
jgi:hypothetical protein